MLTIRPRHLFTVLAVLALGTGVAACGGDDGTSVDDKNAYVTELNDIQTTFSDAVEEVSVSEDADADALSASLDAISEPMATAIEELEGLDAPKEVTKEHDELVTEMTTYNEAIDEANATLEGTPEEIIEGATGLAEASTTFQADFSDTIDEINKKLQK